MDRQGLLEVRIQEFGEVVKTIQVATRRDGLRRITFRAEAGAQKMFHIPFSYII